MTHQTYPNEKITKPVKSNGGGERLYASGLVEHLEGIDWYLNRIQKKLNRSRGLENEKISNFLSEAQIIVSQILKSIAVKPA